MCVCVCVFLCVHMYICVYAYVVKSGAEIAYLPHTHKSASAAWGVNIHIGHLELETTCVYMLCISLGLCFLIGSHVLHKVIKEQQLV